MLTLIIYSPGAEAEPFQDNYSNTMHTIARDLDNSYPRQLVPRTTRTQDNSYPGQLVPKTTRTQDNSCPGQLVPMWHDIISYIIYHIIYNIISYHISYCPGSLCRQVYSEHYVNYTGLCSPWLADGAISNKSTISVQAMIETQNVFHGFEQNSKSALSQLNHHSRLNTWLQWIGQGQLQDETRNIYVWGFDALY